MQVEQEQQVLVELVEAPESQELAVRQKRDDDTSSEAKVEAEAAEETTNQELVREKRGFHQPKGYWSKKLTWKAEWKQIWKTEKKQAWKTEWKKIQVPVWKEIQVPIWKEIQVPAWKTVQKPIWKEIQVPAWKEIQVRNFAP